jgi:uncharacterized membrane protein
VVDNFMSSPKALQAVHDVTPSQASAITQKNVETVAKMHRDAEARRTIGEKVADGFARAIGSWTFIITQSLLLTAWVVANVLHVIKPWDPYPFILLNLALSFQAAYASPIIMMSQNRQGRLSDERNHLALQIALLAEQEDTETLLLLRKICTRLRIADDNEAAEGLSEATDPNLLIDQIKKAESAKSS